MTIKAPRVAPVTQMQLEIARLWLESNEGEGEERAACQAVAAMISRELATREAAMVARLAKRHGCSVAQVREAMQKPHG